MDGMDRLQECGKWTIRTGPQGVAHCPARAVSGWMAVRPLKGLKQPCGVVRVSAEAERVGKGTRKKNDRMLYSRILRSRSA